MKQLRNFILSAGIILALAAFGQGTRNASLPVIATSAGVPGTVFRDCPDCPEMVVITAGKFMMGSSESEKSWAASHGASLESVSDESPQHNVSLRSFALGKYDVTRGEYDRTGYLRLPSTMLMNHPWPGGKINHPRYTAIFRTPVFIILISPQRPRGPRDSVNSVPLW